MNTKTKPKKTITIEKKKSITSLGGKKNYVFNTFCKSYLDLNNAGDAFYSEKERNMFQKWEFVSTTTQGSYNLRNIQTGLFLSSDPLGNLFGTTNNTTSYQMWNVFPTSDKELFVIINKANEYVIDCNIRNILYLSVLEEKNFDDLKKNILFKIFPNLPKKR